MQLDFGEYEILENEVLSTIKLKMMDYNRTGELDLYMKHIHMYDRIFEDRKLDITDLYLVKL